MHMYCNNLQWCTSPVNISRYPTKLNKVICVTQNNSDNTRIVTNILLKQTSMTEGNLLLYPSTSHLHCIATLKHIHVSNAKLRQIHKESLVSNESKCQENDNGCCYRSKWTIWGSLECFGLYSSGISRTLIKVLLIQA